MKHFREFLVILILSHFVDAFKLQSRGYAKFKLDMVIATGRNLKLDVEGGSLCYDIVAPKTFQGSPIVYLPGMSSLCMQ